MSVDYEAVIEHHFVLSLLGHKHRHKVKRQTNSYENYLATTSQNDQNDYSSAQYSSAGSDATDESQPSEFENALSSYSCYEVINSFNFMHQVLFFISLIHLRHYS